MKDYLKYYWSVFKHRTLVRHYCFKAGQYKLGITHDLDKYKISYAKITVKRKRAVHPLDMEKTLEPFQLMEHFHDRTHPYHFEFWLDNLNSRKNNPMKIPYKYIIEIICNWIAIAKENKWCPEEIYSYYRHLRDGKIINHRTDKVINYLLDYYKKVPATVFFYLLKHTEESIVLTNYIENKN